MNLQAQKEANQQNVDLMKQSWQRDDSAVQRRVADLKAAGLNPVLAASGAGSPNSGPIRVSPETMSPIDLSRGYAAAMGSRQYAKTSADAAVAGAGVEAAVESGRATAMEATNKYLYQKNLAPYQSSLAESAAKSIAYQSLKAEQDFYSAMAQADEQRASAEIRRHDANVLAKYPDLLSTSSGMVRDIMGGMGMLGGFLDKVGKYQFIPPK